MKKESYISEETQKNNRSSQRFRIFPSDVLKNYIQRKISSSSFTHNTKHLQFYTTLAAIDLEKTLPIYEINKNQFKFATNTCNNFGTKTIMNKNKKKKKIMKYFWHYFYFSHLVLRF